MAYNEQQNYGLNAAYTRKQQGTANPTDLANLDYAMAHGWSPTTTPTQQPYQGTYAPPVQTTPFSTSQGFNWDEMMNKYKPTYGEYKTPDTSEYDTRIKQLMSVWDPTAIEASLNAKKQAIEARYSQLGQETAQAGESARMRDISALYDIGQVNPLSSGTQSVSSYGETRTKTLQNQLQAQKAAELGAAEMEAYGMKSTGAQQQIATLEKQKAETLQEAESEYTRNRQMWQDATTSVQNAFNIYKAGKELSSMEKQDAWTGLNNLLSFGGTSTFDGMSDKDMSDLTSSIGMNTAQFKNALAYLKKQEILGQKPELKQGDDGTWYTLERDENGNYVPKVLIKGSGKWKPTSGTETSKLSTDIQEMSSILDMVRGEDGKVSPEDYATAKQDWVRQGNKPAEFDAYFSVYRNPQQQVMYGNEYQLEKTGETISNQVLDYYLDNAKDVLTGQFDLSLIPAEIRTQAMQRKATRGY